MKPRIKNLGLQLLSACAIASCGGGGGSAPSPTPAPAPSPAPGPSPGPTPTPPPAPGPVLIEIALSPQAAAVPPGGVIQLEVTGTYTGGSAQALPTSSATYLSSNTSAASVDASGLVAIPVNAQIGATSTISATNSATGLTTSTADSTLVTVTSNGPPQANSVSAVMTTAVTNLQCTAVQPFYWEIGNQEGALASASSTGAGETTVSASTPMSIASASKWIYGMYVLQSRGGIGNLSSTDVSFLHFTSGYTYMGSDTTSATCTAPVSGADSIDYCLTLPSSTSGKLFSSQNPSTVGFFDYDGGHEENHAGQLQPEIAALDTQALGPAIISGLGVTGSALRYNQPLLSGGIFASANDYTALLRAVLSGHLQMLGALGANPVCAWTSGTCNAVYSPIVSEHWHYSMAHWVEDDPSNGDGAFSSPGAFGFYPWIEANKKYYGVISRAAPTGTGIQNGLASAQCGRALRAAWGSGVAQ